MTNHSIKLSVVIIFALVITSVSIGVVPKVSATISVDFNLDELTDLPGLELLRGPPGPEGPQGEQGPKGDTGAQGPPGQDNEELYVIKVTKNITFESGPGLVITTIEVNCLTDTKVTGGGFEMSPMDQFETNTKAFIYESAPTENGWKVSGDFSQLNFYPTVLSVYALCANLKE